MADTARPSHRNWLSVGALAVAAVLFVALLVLSELGLRGLRLDLTEDSLYTLSDGSVRPATTSREPSDSV